MANLDSRLLVTTSDLAKLKARNIPLRDAAFNDQYIARLVSFVGKDMDWVKLGRTAMGICRRPPTVGFMLGPVNVEKKERKVKGRHAERCDGTEVVLPQEVPPSFPKSLSQFEIGRFIVS